jgi:hypothetical protein
MIREKMWSIKLHAHYIFWKYIIPDFSGLKKAWKHRKETFGEKIVRFSPETVRRRLHKITHVEDYKLVLNEDYKSKK